MDRIKVREPLVGAWNYLNHEQAIQQAKLADKRWKDKNPGKLNGLPIGIKDIIDTKDMPTEMDHQYVKTECRLRTHI